MRSTGLGRPPRHSGDRSAQVTVLFDGGWQCVPQGWAGHRDTAATVALKSLSCLTAAGSAFHRAGPATETQRRP